MKFENTEIWGFEAALRGMRNPMNSWERSDSYKENDCFIIGENDMKLAQNLIKAGSEHSKFLRMIHVSSDLSAPRYIWSEFDTYHFNTKNSCSTMHKLFDKEHPISIESFVSTYATEEYFNVVCQLLNDMRKMYFEEDDVKLKNEILREAKMILPEGFIQMRTVDTNYAELRNIYFQRKNHRLPEWSVDFVNWIKTLPYSEELIIWEEKHE